MSCISNYYIPQEVRECMEIKIKNNEIFHTYHLILYQISKQWIFQSYILKKEMDWTEMMNLMKNTIQDVFENKIVILKEFSIETRIQLKEDWGNIYQFMKDHHVIPSKKIFSSLSYWNGVFCRTNRAIYELFAEMVNCFNHMNSNHEDQNTHWIPYYRKRTNIPIQLEGEYFVWMMDYFIMLLDISIENEQKMIDKRQMINGGNHLLHILDIAFYMKDRMKDMSIEDFVDHIYDIPMNEICRKDGFIYEPTDVKRHYQEMEIKCKNIFDRLTKNIDLSYSMEDIRFFITISREFILIDQMKFTDFIPSIWIQQLHVIIISIYEKKSITSIDYILLYHRIQMIRYVLSKIHFL
jgi:hypothetical protein